MAINVEILDNKIGFSIKRDIKEGDTVMVIRNLEIFYGFFCISLNRGVNVDKRNILSYIRYDVIRILQHNKFKDIERGKGYRDLEIHPTRLVLCEKNKLYKWKCLPI